MDKERGLIVFALMAVAKVSSLVMHPSFCLPLSICYSQRKCCLIGCPSIVASHFAASPVSCSNPRPATADPLGVGRTGVMR